MDNPIFETDEMTDDIRDETPTDDITPPHSFKSGEEIELTDLGDSQQPGTSTPRLKQQVLKNKIDSLCRFLGAKGDVDMVDTDRFKMKTSPKTGASALL